MSFSLFYVREKLFYVSGCKITTNKKQSSYSNATQINHTTTNNAHFKNKRQIPKFSYLNGMVVENFL